MWTFLPLRERPWSASGQSPSATHAHFDHFYGLSVLLERFPLFITVADINRSADFYEKVFGGRILSRGDSKGASGHIRIANTWLIVNVGGGPTPDKPTVTLSVLADPDKISSFMNVRVADIQACYKLWKSRGAEFITEPIPKYGEIRCYIRDPDGYIIEVGQSTDLK
jgi:catechol 2,3-dioxygenase-like lactoylglutathione lyase family enzyme